MAKLNLNEIEKRLSEIRGAFPDIPDWLPIEHVVDIDSPALILKVRELVGLMIKDAVLDEDYFWPDKKAWLRWSAAIESIEGLESPDSAPNKTKES